MAGMGVGQGMPPGSRSDYGNDQKALLNTYIHNYLVHEGHFELAKSIRSSNMSLNQQKLKMETGNNKGKSLVNGADDDADSKDDAANRSDGNNKLGDTFLLDYWFIFWDMWSASKRSADKQSENAAGQYWDHQKAKKTIPNQQMQSMVNANGFNNFSRGGMMPNPAFNNLQKTAMANANGRNMPPQLRMQQQMAQQQQMPMDGSDVDINGQQRPQSPMSSGENAPSPKRQRLDGGQFNGGPQMGGPARNQMLGQLPNGANIEAMRMQDPSKGPLTEAQVNQMLQRNNQNLYSQQISNSTKGMINSAAFGGGMQNGVTMSPMMSGDPNMDPQMFNGGGRNMGTNGGALADYQMQLMLLEQQNKKRLMVARQENAHDRQQSLIGQNGFGAPAMSPRGSRTGQSPNGQDRRGTPRLGQGSPLPDGSMPQNTGSPAPPNFADPNQMNLAQQFVPPNGAMMRPPGVNPMNVPNNPMAAQQMEMLQRNGGRLPNGAWPNGPMPGQMGPQGGGPMQNQGEGNQQRGNMPPPQAPPASGNAARSQPSPTQQPAAPPTPSQNSKTTKKKDGKEPKKKNTKKGQSTTGATPNAEADRQGTPPPQTPITPVNPESHLIKGQPPGQTTGAQAQPQTSTAPQPMGMPSAQDNGGMTSQPFGAIDTDMFNLNDFQAMDNTDVLDAFDFDSFLDPSALAGDFGDFQMPGEGVETGTGDA